MSGRRAAIVGVAESDVGKTPHLTVLSQQALAARAALAEAGLIDVALIAYGSTQRTSRSRNAARPAGSCAAISCRPARVPGAEVALVHGRAHHLAFVITARRSP